MKYTLSLLFLILSTLFCSAQIPLAEIEGRLSIYLPGDTTSDEPDCSDSNDEGRIYYEASPVHKLRVCTTNGTTFFWDDLH